MNPTGNLMTEQCRLLQSLRCAHLGEGRLVGLGVVLDGDLRGHASHGVYAAAVAGLDQQQAVRAHARLLHRHNAPV